jgi:hypothetical protein
MAVLDGEIAQCMENKQKAEVSNPSLVSEPASL